MDAFESKEMLADGRLTSIRMEITLPFGIQQFDWQDVQVRAAARVEASCACRPPTPRRILGAILEQDDCALVNIKSGPNEARYSETLIVCYARKLERLAKGSFLALEFHAETVALVDSTFQVALER